MKLNLLSKWRKFDTNEKSKVRFFSKVKEMFVEDHQRHLFLVNIHIIFKSTLNDIWCIELRFNSVGCTVLLWAH